MLADRLITTLASPSPSRCFTEPWCVIPSLLFFGRPRGRQTRHRRTHAPHLGHVYRSLAVGSSQGSDNRQRGYNAGAVLRKGLLLVVSALASAGPGEGVPAFEDGMKVIRGLLERDQCAEGKKRLSKLLGEHARAGYVLGRRVQIEELMRQLAFGVAVPRPDPKDLVSGELLQWNPRDGTIKIRYTPTTMKDWGTSKDGETYLHPASFRGAHSITIKGDRYTGNGAWVFVCDSPDGYIGVAVGLAGRYYAHISSGAPGKENRTDLTGRCESPAVGGKPYTIRVAITETEVACSYGNRPFMRASKKKDVWGSVAFETKFFDEVLLAGRIEPAWIQGLADKERQARLAEFNLRWTPKDDLPAWLFEAAPASGPGDHDQRAWPAEMDHDAYVTVERALALHAGGESLAALRYVDEAPEGTLPDPVRDYLRGVLLHELGRHEEAVASCRKVREKDPDFVPSALVEARSLDALQRTEEALAIYAALLARFPRAADLHAEAALFMGGAGRWQEADRLVAAALGSGVRSERLEAAGRVVHKAVGGPSWPRRHDYESAHYLVHSDMDSKVCFEASKILEQAYAVFSTRLERAPSTTERFNVFLFSGEAGYQGHIADLLGETVPHSAGLYVPALRQLFIWNLPEREDMMKTVRHEGFHQYLHRIMDDPPLWFNEGLAEYFEEAKVVSGTWTTGATRHDHLERLKPPKPLKDFLFLDRKSFMANAGPSYAQGWAFIHFLLHTSRENRQLFDRFWDSFKRIPSHAEAIRAALSDRTIESLDMAFQAHVEGLRAR